MILDPRRNLPGILLLGAGVVFAAVALLLPLVLSTDRGAKLSDTELPPVPDAPPQLTQPEAGLAISNAILAQPIFYSNRQLPEEEETAGEEAGEAEETQVSDLNATVTGVIITPEAKLAVVNVPGDRGSMIVREGMSLDGELAAWRVGDIQAREVNFSASNGQVAKLELEVNERALAAPAAPPPRARATRAANNSNAATNNNPAATPEEQKERQASLAEEVRRRIAERRAQLRAQRQKQIDQQNEEENE